jgi:hypothetical protein
METRKIQDVKAMLDSLYSETRDLKSLVSGIKVKDWKDLDPAVTEYVLHELNCARNLMRATKHALEKRL